MIFRALAVAARPCARLATEFVPHGRGNRILDMARLHAAALANLVKHRIAALIKKEAQKLEANEL